MTIAEYSESWTAGILTRGSFALRAAFTTPNLVTGCDTTIVATMLPYHSNHELSSGLSHTGAARLLLCSQIVQTDVYHPTGETFVTTFDNTTTPTAQTLIESSALSGGPGTPIPQIPHPTGLIPSLFYTLNKFTWFGEQCVFNSGFVPQIDPSVAGGTITIGGSGLTIIRSDLGSTQNVNVNCQAAGGIHGSFHFAPVDPRGNPIVGAPVTLSLKSPTDSFTPRPGFVLSEVQYTATTPVSINFDYNLKVRDAWYTTNTSFQIMGSGLPGSGIPAASCIAKNITAVIDSSFFAGATYIPLHLWDSGAGLTGHAVFTAAFPATKTYGAITWTPSGVGASVSGSDLTAGVAVGTFTGSHPTITHDPYRHLRFDWAKVGSGSLAVNVTVHQDNGAGSTFDKTYAVTLTGTSGTATIDELQGPGSTLIDGTRPSTQNRSRIDSSRFGGIGQARELIFAFANESLTVTNVRLAQTQEAVMQPLAQSSGQVMVGRVDGRDAFGVSGATVAAVETDLTNHGCTTGSNSFAFNGNVSVGLADWSAASSLALSWPFDHLYHFTPSSSPGAVLATLGAGNFFVFPGMAATGLFDTDLHAIGVIGTICGATSVQGGRTLIRDEGFNTSSPTIVRDFHTGTFGYGEDVIKGGVITNSGVSSGNEFTFVPANPPTQTKIAGTYSVIGTDYNYALVQEFIDAVGDVHMFERPTGPVYALLANSSGLTLRRFWLDQVVDTLLTTDIIQSCSGAWHPTGRILIAYVESGGTTVNLVSSRGNEGVFTSPTAVATGTRVAIGVEPMSGTILLAYYDGAAWQTQRSTDLGATWHAGAQIATSHAGPASIEFQRGENRRAMFVWVDTTNINLSMSPDIGGTWSAATGIETGTEVALAVSPVDGELLIVFYDGTEWKAARADARADSWAVAGTIATASDGPGGLEFERGPLRRARTLYFDGSNIFTFVTPDYGDTWVVA